MLCLATYRAYWRQDKYITEVQTVYCPIESVIIFTKV